VRASLTVAVREIATAKALDVTDDVLTIGCAGRVWVVAASKPAGMVGSEKIFLFQNGLGPIYAVSRDGTGCNIPRASGEGGWFLCGAVAENAIPAEVRPTLDQRGYCLLSEEESEQLQRT
jgi:hypothetical protein